VAKLLDRGFQHAISADQFVTGRQFLPDGRHQIRNRHLIIFRSIGGEVTDGVPTATPSQDLNPKTLDSLGSCSFQFSFDHELKIMRRVFHHAFASDAVRYQSRDVWPVPSRFEVTNVG
jgi:hypothetical protein